MLTKEKTFLVMKSIAANTWDDLPELLAAIPQTATMGKVLKELKKIVENVKADCRNEEEKMEALKKEINCLEEQCGGRAAFYREAYQEVKAVCDGKNPEFINCAIFLVCDESGLSDAKQEKLVGTLTGEIEAETKEIADFVNGFRMKYFGDDYEACENAIETGADYISFNFDDVTDHKYNEEDLAEICVYLDKIVGREVFEEYVGFGTDDSVEY